MLLPSVEPINTGMMSISPRNEDNENKEVFKSEDVEWVHAEEVHASSPRISKIVTVVMAAKRRPKSR